MDIDMGSGFTKVKTDGNIVGDVPTKLIKFDPIVSVDKTNIRAIVQNIH